MATYDNIALLGGDASTFVAIIGTTTWEELNAAYESGFYTRFIATENLHGQYKYTYYLTVVAADLSQSLKNIFLFDSHNRYVQWKYSAEPHDEYWTGKAEVNQ